MSDIINQLWGEGKDLTVLQVSVRTFVMFFIALFLLRIGGVRLFSRKSSFDEIVAIMLGAILSRGIVGASPFGTVIIAGILMIIIYRIVGWLTYKNSRFAWLIKGQSEVLYKDGVFNEKKMERAMITKADIMESLRLETRQEEFERIEEVHLETNGRISFVIKKEWQKHEI
jgi:uncharacterized membrane protein YcaP (DUF421 family)